MSDIEHQSGAINSPVSHQEPSAQKKPVDVGPKYPVIEEGMNKEKPSEISTQDNGPRPTQGERTPGEDPFRQAVSNATDTPITEVPDAEELERYYGADQQEDKPQEDNQ